MSCEVYQKMIDRGWRRSGEYCYKPDLKRSCCPQYTIKLDALEFKPSKSQRKLVNRWNRFIAEDEGSDATNSGPRRKSQDQGKSASKDSSFSLIEALHSSEHDRCAERNVKHKFEVILEPSSFTEEKFALFHSYQKDIHKEDQTPNSFESFLVETPLHREPIAYFKGRPAHLPPEYGSYHQMYRLDGELIAMGVIDILPNCVSSVYFMYDTRWEKFSLGKLSALREASLAKEMHDAGAVDMNSLYMGFYIHSCPKMRYKGEYSPSYLVDPEEYTWYPLEKCRPHLDKFRYVSFAHPEHNLEGPPVNAEANSQDPQSVSVEGVLLWSGVEDGRPVIVPVSATPAWRRPSVRHAISSLVVGLGPELSREVVLELTYAL